MPQLSGIEREQISTCSCYRRQDRQFTCITCATNINLQLLSPPRSAIYLYHLRNKLQPAATIATKIDNLPVSPAQQISTCSCYRRQDRQFTCITCATNINLQLLSPSRSAIYLYHLRNKLQPAAAIATKTSNLPVSPAQQTSTCSYYRHQDRQFTCITCATNINLQLLSPSRSAIYLYHLRNKYQPAVAIATKIGNLPVSPAQQISTCICYHPNGPINQQTVRRRLQEQGLRPRILLILFTDGSRFHGARCSSVVRAFAHDAATCQKMCQLLCL